MKKLLAGLLTLGVLLSGCQSVDKNSDAYKFQQEYESLNGVKKENGTGSYMEMEVDINNPMKYATIDEIMDVIQVDGGIIYFGFPECPWCRNAVPVLIEAAQETEVETIYYYNAREGRDTLKLKDDGTIEVIKEKGEDYERIYNALYDSLNVYDGLEDETIKRLYFPTVFFIKDGEVISMHESTLDSQTDSSIPLTKEQHDELKQIYTDAIKEMRVAVCDSAC